MAHIHTEPGQYDHTASAFIVRLDGPEPRLMFHKHKKLGIYLQFGGHVELHENTWQAITHELEEESGYLLHQLILLQPPHRITKLPRAFLHPYPVCVNTHRFSSELDHYHTDSAFAFVTDQLPEGNISEEESQEVILLTRAELAAIPPTKLYPDIQAMGLYVLDTCLATWDQVPASDWA